MPIQNRRPKKERTAPLHIAREHRRLGQRRQHRIQSNRALRNIPTGDTPLPLPVLGRHSVEKFENAQAIATDCQIRFFRRSADQMSVPSCTSVLCSVCSATPGTMPAESRERERSGNRHPGNLRQQPSSVPALEQWQEKRRHDQGQSVASSAPSRNQNGQCLASVGRNERLPAKV